MRLHTCYHLARCCCCCRTCCAAAYYTETLKYNKQLKVRVAGDSRSTDTALCVGYKPDKR
jgi:hypothetical protein